MATKKIQPTNPDKTTKSTDSTKAADRKTNRTAARKTNNRSWC